MVVGLSTGQELGIVAVAAVFIVFALVSSFVLPGRDPDFPGRRLRPFMALVVVLFAAMMGAILALAREDEEAGAHGGGETPAETAPAETTPGETGEPGAPEGDPEAGKAIFASAGCGGCHTLEEAGSSGTIGPNLDESAVSFDEAVQRIRDGGGAMPPFGDQLSDEEIGDVAAFVVEAQG